MAPSCRAQDRNELGASEEGWFTEIGGADLGYCSLAFDYLMICRRLTGDDRATSAASRLLEFLAPHLHPDLTAAAEAGICRNPYVGQIGFLLLDSHPSARAIVARMSTLADSAKRIRPYLDDDLRLCRWGILPVLAALLAGPPDLHHHRRVGRARGLAAALSPSVGLAPEVAVAAFFLSFFSTRLIPGLIGLMWTAVSTKRQSPLPQSRAA